MSAALAFSVATSVEDIANYAALKNIQAFMRYFGKYPNDTSLEDIKELFLPYRYGHATQVKPSFASTTVHEIHCSPLYKA